MPIKKILFISTGLGLGGAEVFLADLTAQLIPSGIECTVVSLKGRGPLSDRLINIGCKVIALRSDSFLEKICLLNKVRRVLLEYRPDIIQGWLYHGNLLATLSAISTGIPVAWSIHHSLHDIQKESFALRCVLRFSRSLSGKPKMIHYCSTVSANQHKRFGFSTSHFIVIPNGIDCERFYPDPAQRENAQKKMGLAIDPDAFVIGHIGRYHLMKDHANFLRAAAFFAAKQRKTHFIMAGKGVTEENKALTVLCDTLGLRDHVVFLGERSDISKLLHGLDLVSTSSAWGEAFPISIGEAMATGIPCAATDIGDCSYLIGDTGKIVPTSNHQALANAWIDLLSETGERRQQRQARARQRILDNFDVRNIAARFLELYKGIQ